MLDPEILRALRAVVDPELGINVVDLGLIYECFREGEQATVVMTMTTPACPLHETITEDVKTAVADLCQGVKSVEVKLVFEPRWTPERMSDEAREQLGY